MSADPSQEYTLKSNGNGVYFMNIEGEKTIANQALGFRDAVGVWDTDSVTISAKEQGRLLLIEVPMQF